MRSHRVLAAVLCALAVVPGVSSAGNECRIVPDAVGDVRHPGGQATPLVAGETGGAVDLTGFGIYAAPWGELLVDVAVADMDAPWHELADARSYVVEWSYGRHIYRFEALDVRGAWSFAASRRVPLQVPGELEPEETWPLAGVVDPEARTVSMIGSLLMLGDPAPGVLEMVHALAVERRNTGVESAVYDRFTAGTFDRAPDDYDGWATIDLTRACAPEMPQGVGATPLCRVLTDAEYDPSMAGVQLGSDGRAVDLTGVFVGSTAEALVLELGVVDPSAQADGMETSARHLIRFDLDGRSYEASALRLGEAWTFEFRDYWSDTWTPTQGSVSRDRVNIEIPFEGVPGAERGARLSAFDVSSTENARIPGQTFGAPRAKDHAPDGDVPVGTHSLAADCDPYR